MHPWVFVVGSGLAIGGFFISPFIGFWWLVLAIVVWIYFINSSGENWFLGLFLLIFGSPIFGGIIVEKGWTYFTEDSIGPVVVQEDKKRFIVEYDYEEPSDFKKEVNKAFQRVQANRVKVQIKSDQEVREQQRKEQAVREASKKVEEDSFSLLDWLGSKPLKHLDPKDSK